MPKVTDADVNGVLDLLENATDGSSKLFAQVHEDHGDYMHYIDENYESVLSLAELEIFEFGVFFILSCLLKAQAEVPTLDEVITLDEAHLELIESSKSFSFQDYLEEAYDEVEEKPLLEFTIEFVYEENEEMPALSKSLIASFLYAMFEEG